MSREEKEPTQEKKPRIVLEVTQEFNDRVEALGDLVRAHSKAEVVRDAIQLYEYLAELQRDGWEFKVRSPEGKEETPRFFLYPKPRRQAVTEPDTPLSE